MEKLKFELKKFKMPIIYEKNLSALLLVLNLVS